MKKGDFLVIFLIGLFSLGLVFFFNQRPGASSRLYASVQISGQEVERIYFKKARGREEFRGDYGYNIVEYDGERIRVVEADCRDQVDVRQGWIENPGETLICLPHRFVLEIKSMEEVNEVDHINY